jgi:hypothetical protein
MPGAQTAIPVSNALLAASTRISASLDPVPTITVSEQSPKDANSIYIKTFKIQVKYFHHENHHSRQLCRCL